MTPTFTIRPLAPHEWQAYRAIRLRSLADSPDAFCSTLAEEEALPLDTWSARVARAAVSGIDLPLVADIGGTLAGLVWAKVDAEDAAVVNLFQVWVAPESRGCGIAGALLREAARWATSKGASCVKLDVTSGDTAAARLYLREGFRNVGEPVPMCSRPPLQFQAMELRLDTVSA